MQNFGTWTNEPATEKQISYIKAMQEHSPYPIPKFEGKTKGEAAEYIDKYVWPAYNFTAHLDELEAANIAGKVIRLIDATTFIEGLEWCREQEGPREERYWDDLIERVEAQPTIEAIPVEWIKHMQHKHSKTNKLMSDAYAAVLGEWLDEQEGDDANN